MRTTLSIATLAFVAVQAHGQLVLPYAGTDASASLSSFQITKSGTSGRANTLFITNATNTSDALLVNTIGLGRAAYFTINNPTNSQIALRADSNGSGIGIFGFMSGTGRAGFFRITNAANTSAALQAQTDGSGPAFKAQAGTGLAGDFSGNVNVSGSLTAASFVGSGAGLTGVSPSGSAGGDLAGTYPNPTIGPGKVDSTKLASDRFSMAKISGGNVEVSNLGRVSIGLPVPATQFLSVFSSMSINTASGADVVNLSSVAFGGNIAIKNASGNVRAETTLVSAGGVLSIFRVRDGSGAIQAGLSATEAGVGNVFADTKNFRVPNPEDLKTDIWYASVEGPEAAAYLGGTARLQNGRAFVPFPSHFASVAVSEGMTVQLTPHSVDTYGLAILEKSVRGITVGELQRGKGNFEFDWEIKAVRKGHEDYRVIRQWDEDINPKDSEAEWKARLKSIAAKARASAIEPANKVSNRSN